MLLTLRYTYDLTHMKCRQRGGNVLAGAIYIVRSKPVATSNTLKSLFSACLLSPSLEHLMASDSSMSANWLVLSDIHISNSL